MKLTTIMKRQNISIPTMKKNGEKEDEKEMRPKEQ